MGFGFPRKTTYLLRPTSGDDEMSRSHIFSSELVSYFSRNEQTKNRMGLMKVCHLKKLESVRWIMKQKGWIYTPRFANNMDGFTGLCFWPKPEKMHVLSPKDMGTWWWQLKYFLFSPLPGEMIQFDEHIFQMGWNRQLIYFWKRNSNFPKNPWDVIGVWKKTTCFVSPFSRVVTRTRRAKGVVSMVSGVRILISKTLTYFNSYRTYTTFVIFFWA